MSHPFLCAEHMRGFPVCDVSTLMLHSVTVCYNQLPEGEPVSFRANINRLKHDLQREQASGQEVTKEEEEEGLFPPSARHKGRKPLLQRQC